jgi:flagellar biogenesis protein FliO
LLTLAAGGKKRPTCFKAKEGEMRRVLFGVIAVLLVGLAVAAPAAAADTAAAEQPQVADTATGDQPQVDEPDAHQSSGGFLSYEEPAKPAQPSFGSLMLRLVLSMVVILALIYGVLTLVRLLARKTKAAARSEKLIRIVDRAVLDQKRAIYLVKVIDRLLVVGVGVNDVRTLAQIEDQTVVENVQDTEFSGHLQSFLGRLAGRSN